MPHLDNSDDDMKASHAAECFCDTWNHLGLFDLLNTSKHSFTLGVDW